MQLSKRMLAIAEMVSPGSRVADVGCDHGYLPIWLVSQQISPRAVAMDIGDGPLERARENIRQHGLLEYIETRKSDGTEALQAGECDTLIIAGMGGPLMERILSDHWDITRGFREIILEPQSDVRHMRIFLQQNGYRITDENMIYEDGKYYPVLRVTEGKMEHLTPVQYQYGPCLLQNRNPVLKSFLKWEENLKAQLLEKLRKTSGERAEGRVQQLTEELLLIRQAIALYES